jgi:HPt (histidine-containing phosphotransfer) domain-containing protein
MTDESKPSPFVCPSAFSEWRDQPDFFLKLFQTFVSETHKDLQALQEAVMSSDAAKVASVAHRIKGGAGAVGALPMRTEAARIEGMGRTEQLGDVTEGLSSLCEEFDRFCGFISKLTVLEDD